LLSVDKHVIACIYGDLYLNPDGFQRSLVCLLKASGMSNTQIIEYMEKYSSIVVALEEQKNSDPIIFQKAY
jgi:hypothetical protein